jgi:tRNA(Ile)-lysidine synthase
MPLSLPVRAKSSNPTEIWMAEDPFHWQFRSALPLMPKGSRSLVAVSGGQDSLCLLGLLKAFSAKQQWKLEVAHLDHRWRTNSEEVAQKVMVLAKTWQLPFHLAIAQSPPTSEAAARTWRYAWLGELALSLGCTQVLTAHTRTDVVETFLFNLLRGSGSDGLTSLVAERALYETVKLIRPLLHFSRTQTGQYCQIQQLPVCIDPTNFDLTYRRNRIRLELLPYLQQHFNPQVESSLARTVSLLEAEADFLEHSVLALAETCIVEGRLHRQQLRNSHLALQRRVVRHWLMEQLGYFPNFDQIAVVLACLDAPHRTRTSPLSAGWLVEVQNHWLILVSSLKQP